MPIIIIKHHQWRQTKKRIIIHVPLNGHPKNVDLSIMDNYIKISFPPFILELFLWGNVLEEESQCILTDTEAIFSLRKASEGSDWPCLEIQNLKKEQKRDFRNRILEKAQSLSESRAKSKSEKRQHLQKEAVKVQINLDTATLNKIESLKNAHRKAAMRDLEEWRSNAEIPILQNITGEIQENRKKYRPPLKWFKDDSDIVRSREILEEQELKEETRIIKKQQNESIIIEELKEESIVTGDSEENSIIGKKMKEKTSIEQKLEERLIIKENLENESTVGEYLRKKTDLGENFQEKTNISEAERTTTQNRSFSLKESSDSFENSESDCEIALCESTSHSINEMDQKSSRRFHMKMKKQKSNQNLIDKVLKSRYSKLNGIFDKPTKAIPFPRRSGTINITFSERAFPTPARESSQAQEQEWLAKQTEARNKIGFVVEDLRPEERDPQWLKDKGDDFFKVGNYLAAISAYTHGIKISDKMTALYMNRSAAHYALGNYYRCIDDCSKVLELMVPECESNRISRAKCYARRGAALCKLSAPQHGIPELEAALKLDPNNESIRRDLHTVKQYFNIKE